MKEQSLKFWNKRRSEQIEYMEALYKRKNEYSVCRYKEILQSATSVLNNIWGEIQSLTKKQEEGK